MKKLDIIVQGFYGNKTATTIDLKDFDKFMLGHLDGKIMSTDKIDRTIVNIPNTDNIVIVYNKYEEEIESKETTKPVVVIPEKNIELYSRCIVCRMDKNGELESLEDDDFDKFIEYLAD